MKIILQSRRNLAGIFKKFITWTWWDRAGVVVFWQDQEYVITTRFPFGVCMIPFCEFVKHSKWECYEASIDSHNLVKDWLFEQIGKKYDWSYVFRIFSDRDRHKEDRWHDGELVASATRKGGRDIFNYKINSINNSYIKLLPIPMISRGKN